MKKIEHSTYITIIVAIILFSIFCVKRKFINDKNFMEIVEQYYILPKSQVENYLLNDSTFIYTYHYDSTQITLNKY